VEHSTTIKPEYPSSMIRNRSVPTNILLPHITYKDLPAAIQWLNRAFGFVEHFRYGGPSGAQLHLGDAWIMVRTARVDNYKTPAELGFATQSLTIFVEEIEQHFARAKAAGAKIVEDLNETEYGEFQYGAVDLEGHPWLFSRHARDLSPDAWGATITNPLEN
jgi:uncharacterized glyoxalase superfamily protein PhnB